MNKTLKMQMLSIKNILCTISNLKSLLAAVRAISNSGE